MIIIMFKGLVVYERSVDIMLGLQPFTGGIGFSLLHWTRTHVCTPGTWMLYKDIRAMMELWNVTRVL